MRAGVVSKKDTTPKTPDSPQENYVFTALKVVGYLVSIWLFVKVGIPNFIEGHRLKNSVPHPLWNSVTVEQREIWKSGAQLSMLGYVASTPAVASTVLGTLYTLYYVITWLDL